MKQINPNKTGFVQFEDLPHVVSYSQDPVQRETQYLSPETAQSLRRLNQELRWIDLLEPSEVPEKVDVGDMSRADGNPYGRHKAHRQGKEVDMRPATQAYTHAAVGSFQKNPNYSREKTQALVDLLRFDPNVKRILFNDPAIQGVSPAADHDNHLHVIFNK